MIKLRPYQQSCTPAVIKYIRENPGRHPVVALPTGSGKTLCIADLIKFCTNKWGIKVLVLSHVKEILEQNHKSLENYLGCKVALNSSMLKRREVGNITVAGIQSVYKNPDPFKDVKLVIIDEAHLVSTAQNTMYQKFLSGIPKYVCVGFTATPFRLGTGYIYGPSDDAMFDDVCYDWSSSDNFVKLIEDGYLCKLTTKRTDLEMDTSNIKLVAGDYNEKQLAAEFDRDAVTNQAIKEIIAAGKNRKKWLIFAIDINHAEHIAEVLIRNGIPTAPIHSKMEKSGFSRQQSMAGFANGRFRCVVNVNILTTGFDDPEIDLIALLRPTTSPVLHVQTLGRGSRVSPGKTDCLVLDFAGNTMRLGPINDVVGVTKKGKGKEGDAPCKICKECGSVIPAATRVCPDCNYKFLFEHGLSATPAEETIIEENRPVWLTVNDVIYSIHSNYGMTSSVKVSYVCGKTIVNEWICVEHSGYAKAKADHWIRYRGGKPCSYVDNLMEQSETLKKPKKILVTKKQKYMVVADSQF